MRRELKITGSSQNLAFPRIPEQFWVGGLSWAVCKMRLVGKHLGKDLVWRLLVCLWDVRCEQSAVPAAPCQLTAHSRGGSPSPFLGKHPEGQFPRRSWCGNSLHRWVSMPTSLKDLKKRCKTARYYFKAAVLPYSQYLRLIRWNGSNDPVIWWFCGIQFFISAA